MRVKDQGIKIENIVFKIDSILVRGCILEFVSFKIQFLQAR